MIKRVLGFTLVELMVVTALIGIISVIGGDILITVFRAYAKAKMISEIERAGNYAVSFINTEMRGGSGVVLKSGSSCFLGASECLTYTDAAGVLSEVGFSIGSCPAKNGTLYVVKSGAISEITNSNLTSGVSVSRINSRPIFSLSSGSGVTYVGMVAQILEPCLSPVIGNAQFDTMVKIRGY